MNDREKLQPSPPRGDGIPVPLLDSLHEANAEFHKARQHVEEANEALVNPSEERERASQEMRDAEHAVEAAEEIITKELKARE